MMSSLLVMEILPIAFIQTHGYLLMRLTMYGIELTGQMVLMRSLFYWHRESIFATDCSSTFGDLRPTFAI